MRTLSKLPTLSLLLLLSAFCFALPAIAQVPGVGHTPAPPPSGSLPSPGSDDIREHQAKEAAKKANLARQTALRNDTEKLFKLATELKEQVDKSNANILSLDVVKKADEIEKLAHSVKEKMKGPS